MSPWSRCRLILNCSPLSLHVCREKSSPMYTWSCGAHTVSANTYFGTVKWRAGISVIGHALRTMTSTISCNGTWKSFAAIWASTWAKTLRPTIMQTLSITVVAFNHRGSTTGHAESVLQSDMAFKQSTSSPPRTVAAGRRRRRAITKPHPGVHTCRCF